MNDPADVSDIDATHARWCNAYRQGDTATILALLTDDYLLWAPGRDALTRADLAPRLQGAFDAYAFDPSYERIDLLVDGDLAIDIGWDVQRLTPRHGGNRIEQRQRVCLVLRREHDRAWRYARGMSQPGAA